MHIIRNSIIGNSIRNSNHLNMANSLNVYLDMMIHLEIHLVLRVGMKNWIDRARRFNISVCRVGMKNWTEFNNSRILKIRKSIMILNDRHELG